ncbi:MAG: cytochrome c oxidase subunit I [Bryobacterales bacterium]|nr:cytochrome c oxidase subunit I [Bryobacterales bacterium]
MSTVAATPPQISDQQKLDAVWLSPGGFFGWFTHVEHKAIGLRYIVTAFVFLILGGLEALAMRLQLAVPDNHLLNPDLYNQVFSTHGTTMMFLFAVPVMEGMGLYLVPLLVGTRNIAFPRLMNFSYWMFLFGGLLLYAGFFLNTGPEAGWFSYVPLSGPSYSPGKRIDIWAQMITFTEISTLAVAVELIVTIMKLRAPGMAAHRIPLFAWAMFVQSWMVVFAMPAVMVASTMLLMDRSVGTHFFNPFERGDPLLWQHLFWFFGHPEVYLIFVPALGMISHIILASTHRPIVGYTPLVLSLIATAFLGFGLWVHHMFTTGLPQLGESYFTAASMVIAIPTGVQIFCWIASLWGARIRVDTAFLFALGFFSTFIAGGLTGVMIASIPFDTQVHDTYFIVAHFHYTLIGGAVFPLLGAVYHWYPKMTGRKLSESLGRINFALVFVGFHLTFFPLHILGMHGMPRRVYTYQPGLGWEGYNLAATIGALILATGGGVFLYNVFRSRTRGEVAGNNPWGADSLEWSTTSPPASYNWVEPPVVSSRYPLWDPAGLGGVAGLSTDYREVLTTTDLDATPHHRYRMPGPTVWPFVTAVVGGIGLVSSIFQPILIYPIGVLTGIPLTLWLWPRGKRG